MKCSLCGFTFREDESIGGCVGCAFSTSCAMIRCPNCGFEEPAKSTILATLKRWRKPNDH